MWGPVVVGTSPVVLLGPLVDTVLVKNVRLVRVTESTGDTLVKYGVDGLADGQLLAAVLLDFGPMVWTDGTWLVLEPGEQLVASSSAAVVTSSGHGTVLTGGGEFP